MERPAVLEKIRYFILRALRNMRQWPFLCSAAVLTMAVALASVATFFLVVVNVEQLAARWTSEIQVIAYLEQPPNSRELPGLLKQLRAFPEVEAVEYISPAAAMESFSQRLGNDAGLLEGMKADLLPASFELGLKPEFRNREGIAGVIEQLENRLQLDDLRYGQQWLERFNRFVSVLRFVSLVLGSFLLLAALFIVSNTIKLTLYARRDELEIMALVGATMRFIKLPFLIEGALQGLFGGIISLLFLLLSYRFLLMKTLTAFWLTPSGFELLFLTADQQLLLILAGVLLGVLGSLSSLKRFVRL